MAIQIRRGTASQWTSANPTLASGEPGYETDSGKLKVGNGSTAWVSLSYFAGTLSDLIGDTTPQLGGNLDLNGHTVGVATAGDLTKLHGVGNLSGNNTGDQDLSGYATTAALTSGLNGKQASLGFTAENVANKGVANGYASLDNTGKVPAAQMISAVVEYKGTWDASANSPTLADGTGNTGDEYRVSTAGTRNLGSGSISYGVGDFVIYSGTIWQKIGGGGGGAFDLVTDTTPQLGGNLDLNGFTVGAATAADLTELHSAGTLSGNNTGDQDLSVYALKPGFVSIATSAGTTTAVVTDPRVVVYTGTTTHTYKLPTTSVLGGDQRLVINDSTGIVTVQSSGANPIVALPPSTYALFTARQATPTTAAQWHFSTVVWRGTQAQYAALGSWDANVVYILTDIGTRVATVASSATPSIDVSTCEQAEILTLVHNITGITFTNWKHGQKLVLVLKSVSAQTISAISGIQNGPAAMLTTTVPGKYHEILLKYNSGISKAVVMAADATGY